MRLWRNIISKSDTEDEFVLDSWVIARPYDARPIAEDPNAVQSSAGRRLLLP